MAKVIKKNNSTTMSKTSAKKSLSQDALYQTIQKKAYELFEKRGYSHGNDWQDWLEAERIVRSGRF